MDTKYRVDKKYSSPANQVTVYRTVVSDNVGLFAEHLLDKWGLVAAMPDGEDSAGRAKLRLPTSEEVVTRAFDMAERFFAEARKRGHLVDIPDLNEINKEEDEKLAAEEAARAQ